METIETQSAVDNFLSANGIKFDVRLVGATKRDDWECDAWRVKLSGKHIFETDYFTGIGHRNKVTRRAKNPTAADVLYSLVLDSSAADQSFDDWCGDYGYSNNSLKAFDTYRACCKNGAEMRKLFSPDQRRKLAELLQDY